MNGEIVIMKLTVHCEVCWYWFNNLRNVLHIYFKLIEYQILKSLNS